MKRTTIEWFDFSENTPEDHRVIFVYWEGHFDEVYMKTDWEYYNGALFNENYSKQKIEPGMLWAYWPDLQMTKHTEQ